MYGLFFLLYAFGAVIAYIIRLVLLIIGLVDYSWVPMNGLNGFIIAFLYFQFYRVTFTPQDTEKMTFTALITTIFIAFMSILLP